MGLDVYLYKSDLSIEQVMKKLNGNDEEEDPPAPIAEGHGARIEACDLGEVQTEADDSEDDFEEGIQIPSAVHPKHYFKVGYFRSSYNESGIQRILARRLQDPFASGLDYVFPAQDDGYARRVDWGKALVRARQLRDAFVANLVQTGPYEVMTLARNPFVPDVDYEKFDTSAKVLEAFTVERKRKEDALVRWEAEGKKGYKPWDNYSNREGEFSLGEGFQVHAVIHGVESSYRGKQKCVYLVARCPDEVDEETGVKSLPFTYYRQALEIVVETCEYVLGQKDPHKYYLHWSG